MTTQDTKIPADVLDAAKAIAEQPWLTRAERDRMTLQIAKALLAERKRCASLARSWAVTCKRVGQIEGEGVAEDIAMVIEDGISAAPKCGEA